MTGGEQAFASGMLGGVNSGLVAGPQGLMRRASTRNPVLTTFSLEVFDNEVVPSSLSSISPVLRVASEIEAERPRVAYLCRFFCPSLHSNF